MVNIVIEKRLAKVVAACQAISRQSMPFSDDPLTDQFCRDYLQNHITIDALQQKVRNELCYCTWYPLGRLLVIVSESDILGNLLALFAGYITGNHMLIKARRSTLLLQLVKMQLALTDEELTIIDWNGGKQDDQALLKHIDGVVLAGSLSLIQHFRQTTPHPIRLIEFGPKLSAIVICGQIDKNEQFYPALINNLMKDVTLFSQRVCSAPRFILVESVNVAKELLTELRMYLPKLSHLDAESKLIQSSHFRELLLLNRINKIFDEVIYDAHSGWGITLSTQLNPEYWFAHGFHLVIGDIDAHLKKAHQLWKGQLQVLGVAGDYSNKQYGFTRYCSIGKMHYRPLNAPHDGFFELSSLVNFISKEAI